MFCIGLSSVQRCCIVPTIQLAVENHHTGLPFCGRETPPNISGYVVDACLHELIGILFVDFIDNPQAQKYAQTS